MVFSLTACASDDDRINAADGDSTVTSASAGAVALFTPSDGITLNLQTPLNKWAKLVPDLTDALTDAGFKKGDVTHASSDSLDKQSRAIQDFVVNHLSDKANANDSGITIAPANMTLLVAPVVETDASTRQYGDYVSQELSTGGSDAQNSGNGIESGSSDGDDSSSSSSSSFSSSTAHEDGSADDSSTGSGADGTSDDGTDATGEDSSEAVIQSESVERLVSSLKLAKESGMHVVLLANSIEGYQPDAFVRFSDAETIGRLQAEKVVSKLELTKASKDNPKHIEVLVPYTAAGTDGEAGDTTFAQEAFSGIWQVLGPYYRKGVVMSPSGALDSSSTEKDWQAVSYDASQEKSTAKVLDERLADSSDTATSSSPARINAIIAMNDYIASDVVKELDNLGYTGSAADINPQITISGIVGNITGKRDLSREAVPDPIKSPENDDASNADDADDNEGKDPEDKTKDSQWPLVTGYGAYLSNIPSVVKGRQWMTGVENRQTIAKDIAEACGRLNKGDGLKSMSSVKSSEVGGVKNVMTISEEPLAVSASNLKAELIDPGYITLADAGL
jgi:ABC-type xylose transport system substrate-binding protein